METKNPSNPNSQYESAKQRMQHPQRYIQQAASIILKTLLPEELIDVLHEAGYPATEDKDLTMESYARDILVYMFTGMMPHKDMTYMLAIDRIVFAYDKYVMEHPATVFIIAVMTKDVAQHIASIIWHDLELVEKGGNDD